MPKDTVRLTPMLRGDQKSKIPDTPEFRAIAAGLGLKPDCTFAEFNVRALQINAAKGNSACVKELWERLEGKVTQPVDVSEREPIKIHLVTE